MPFILKTEFPESEIIHPHIPTASSVSEQSLLIGGMNQWIDAALDRVVPSRLIRVIEFNKQIIILICVSPPFTVLIHTVLSMILRRMG